MMNYRIAILSLILSAIGLISCDKDEDNNSPSQGTFNLNIAGLEDLGSGYTYEGWIIVDGSPVTTGTFTVDANGTLSQTQFEIAQSDLDAASTFVLTIEPSPDSDPSPSSVHILAGDFDGSNATLGIDHAAAIGTHFHDAAGDYILATPTDSDDSNEESGIWFLNNSSGSPATGLTLPTLPEGWAYEGWVVIDGVPVSTGTFLSVSNADDSAPFSGSNAGPPFPGEDFLNNAPSGLSFPTSLLGGTAVISVEPVPDNSTNPFLLKPLVGSIPSDAAVHSVLSIAQNLNFPSGTATK